MTLNNSQKQQVESWFAEKAPRITCPVCGGTGWDYGDRLVVALTMEGKDVQLDGTTVPMVQLICSTCAYVLHFGARAMGLLD